FNNVPTRAAESAFQLLNDLAVTAHRAIETLQVAVDYEDQVVELFATGQCDGTERFGLVAFAVAQKSPNLLLAGIFDTAIGQVLVETRLIDRHDGTQSHRHRGE